MRQAVRFWIAPYCFSDGWRGEHRAGKRFAPQHLNRVDELKPDAVDESIVLEAASEEHLPAIRGP